jgi:hypothetical protein
MAVKRSLTTTLGTMLLDSICTVNRRTPRRRRARRTVVTTISAAVAGAVFAMPAAASPFETFPIADAYPVVNVCTGEWTMLTLSGVVHVREQLTAGGTFHLLQRFEASWTTDDGFAGTARQVRTVTDREPGTFDDFVTHLTVHFIGRNGSGAVVRSRELVVLNVRDGEMIVDRQRLDTSCTGHR